MLDDPERRVSRERRTNDEESITVFHVYKLGNEREI